MRAALRSSFIHTLFVVLLVTGSSAAVLAQGAITGTVTDPSGGALPGATVEAAAQGRVVATTVTGPAGQFRLDVPVGSYEVTVRLAGFATEAVVLAAGTARDFELGIAPFDDTVVVTASRTAQSRATVTESLTVFTADDIAALGSHSVADLVAQIPGLDTGATGREGSQTSLFSRGGESDYNQVLIDGVRVNINGGQFDFSRVSTAEIDRVEVVRGAQSALYGSDAIGSVVQIFTKRGSGPPRLSGTIEGGSFQTFRGDARVLGSVRDRVDYQIGVGRRSTEGAFADELTEKDEFDQTTIDGNVGGRINAYAALRSGFRHTEANGRVVGALDYAPGDTGQRYNTGELSWYANFDGMLTSSVSHRADVNVFRYDSLQEDAIADVFPPLFVVLEGTPGALFPDSPRLSRIIDEATYDDLLANPAGLGPDEFLASTPFGVFFGDFPFDSDTRFRRYDVDYQVDATWMDDQVLSVGYEYLDENGIEELEPETADYTVTNHAFFAQQQFTLADRWFVTLGARVDDNSRFGTEVSPKFSAGGFPVPFSEGPVSSVKVFANVGRGIKNPTFGELFDGAFSDGNPDLVAERARTIDAGAEVTFADQRVLGRITYFDNSYEDQVAFFSSPGGGGDGIPDFINVAGSEAKGIELEAALQRPAGGFTASASYAYVDTEVVATVSTSEQFQPGQPLLRRPKHSGTLRLNYLYGPASVQLNLRAVGQRHDAAFAGLFTPSFQSVDITVNPAYTLLSLGGQYRVHDALTLFLQIENLTDERYSTALGYPGMPRAVVLGGRYDIAMR